MSRGETDGHRNLKRLAFEWTQAAGFGFIACEVRVPRSGYRADVAALSRKPASPEARVALFECKQCRADLLRDHADEAEAKGELRVLAERIRELRILLAVHRPDLRRGESLFAEFDSYDFGGMRHETLHGLEARLDVLQRKLLTGGEVFPAAQVSRRRFAVFGHRARGDGEARSAEWLGLAGTRG